MKTCPTCALRYPDESAFCFIDGSSLAAAQDPFTGRTIAGRYRVLDPIGETGWAKHYGAQYRLLARPVTLKLLKGTIDGERKVTFLNALGLARRCTHPHVAEVEGGGVTEEGIAYVVQPSTSSVPLGEVLKRGPMAVDRAIAIVAQMLMGLGRIHDFGGLHGDIRPSNVMVSERGHVHLVDAGVGRTLLRDPWEQDPMAFMSQLYLAPELSVGARASIPGDLYAVGVTTFQMLNGGFPVEADDVSELREIYASPPPKDLAKIMAGELPKTSEKISGWIAQLLDRDPQTRLGNAHLALSELRQACGLANVPVPAKPGESSNGEAEPPKLDANFFRWKYYAGLFKEMAEQGFPQGAPAVTQDALSSILGRIQDLEAVGKKALYEYQNLVDVGRRAREGRQGIADQMATLNDEASELRQELLPLTIAASRHAQKAAEFPAKLTEQHRNVVRWEGKSAFKQPYPELAEAYRQLADLVEKWHGVRSAQLTCEEGVAEKQGDVDRLEEQLAELRATLQIHESNVSAEVDACEQALAELGDTADELEPALLNLASRFSAPLRSKPELGALFKKLQGRKKA